MGHGSRSRRRDEAEGDDDASDAEREEARERQREHKHRQRRRKTERRHAAVNEILSKIAPPSRASFTSLEDTPAWRDGNPIEWSSMGPSCDPASMANDGNEATMRGDDTNKGASTTAAAAAQPVVNLRAMRKRWQVESFAVVLRELERERAARDDADAMPPMRVVDFGAGSGNLILPLAKRFPDVRFTAVEMKRRSAEILERRAAAAGLTNVDVVVDMIEKTTFGFDVGVALHACGNATDFTIARCLAAAAAFAVSPCCIGKLKFSLAGGSSFSATNKDWTAKGGDGETHGNGGGDGETQVVCPPITHPRSKWMATQLAGPGDFAALAQAADTGHGDGANADAITYLGERAKRNVELDRVEAAREAGYAVESLRLIRAPDAPPNKSDLLVGVPAGRAGALERLRVP